MKASRVLLLLIILGMVLVVFGLLGYRFNLTASLPLGVYRATSEPATRGSVVHACLPPEVAKFARRRGYLGPGSCPSGVRPIGKMVLAVAGDTVTLSRGAIRVNGQAVPNSATLLEDSRGRPLPHYRWGTHRLGTEELWLFSPYHRNSYDSRYFGPVFNTGKIKVLQPLWTAAGAL